MTATMADLDARWAEASAADKVRAAREALYLFQSANGGDEWAPLIEAAWSEGLLTEPEIDLYVKRAPEIIATRFDDHLELVWTISFLTPHRNLPNQTRLRIAIDDVSLAVDGVRYALTVLPSMTPPADGEVDWPAYAAMVAVPRRDAAVEVLWRGSVVDSRTGRVLVTVSSGRAAGTLRGRDSSIAWRGVDGRPW